MLLPLRAGSPGGMEMLIILVWLLIPLAISYYIYKDAQKRSSNHELAWGLGAFFGPVVVWVLYFVVRDEVG